MKQLLITALAVTAAAVTSYGQGTIFINNLNNTGVYNGNGGTVANPVFSSLVTQNGLIFTTDSTEAYQFSGGSGLIADDFSWALYGGASANSLTLITSETGSQIAGDNSNVNYGDFTEGGDTFSVAGTTASSTVYLELYVWEGNTYSTYAAALAGGDYTGVSGVFTNPSGGGAAQPFALTGMPDVLVTVPEPTSMALAALGGASLLLFRRKK
ncbi:MAG: PEP-CTERM sorting domain-containing protein [Rouxiella aceris]|uniref:PEP-CTERM sorting domain-containing protein n=1 Tax=Rouxiella aceris TaxID=2703884 RepID=UPI00283C2F62|nr:PEP-CTERM sorting domain-containing protein [Rouxiella aceris]MDR3434490.1 PEP-CTERM sorting domain-containing protein [Rouxiella aceris]